jgi:hypothetical protein
MICGRNRVSGGLGAHALVVQLNGHARHHAGCRSTQA